jgi:DNA-binding NtrC family response regulator
MLENKPRILIVDDEKSVRELLQEELTILNYICVTAGNAAEAQRNLSENTFEVVILDIRLPDMNGMDLLKQINANYPAIPLIMLTAVKDVEVAVETMKAGARDYITKPFNMDRINQAIHMALAKRDQSEDATQDPTMCAIEAIALGVETRQEMIDIHSEKVVQQTIDIAQRMGFSSAKIQQWMDVRTEQRSRKVKQVTDSISKLVQNPASPDNPLQLS